MTTITEKTLKSGIVVRTHNYPATKFIPYETKEKYFYYQGKQLAWLMRDNTLCFNSKYWRDKKVKKELKDIFSLIRKRAKAKAVSEYLNI